MSMGHGPWIGGVLDAAFAIMGNAVNARRISLRVGLIVLAIGIPTGAGFYSYVSVGRANAKSVSLANSQAWSHKKVEERLGLLYFLRLTTNPNSGKIASLLCEKADRLLSQMVIPTGA
jgi:hypothetical protein